MKEQDFKDLKRIIELIDYCTFVSFNNVEKWSTDGNTVSWVEDGKEYSEEIFEEGKEIGGYMVINLRLCTGCTETNFFPMSKKVDWIDE